MESNPGKSLFEIQAMMENPMEHLDEIGGAFSEMQGQMGGDMERQAIYSLFGGNVSKSAILKAQKEGGGEIDFSKLTSEGVSTKDSAIMGGANLSNFVPAVEKSSSRIESVVERVGEKIVSRLDPYMEGMFNVMGIAPLTEEQKENKARQAAAYKSARAEAYEKRGMTDPLDNLPEAITKLHSQLEEQNNRENNKRDTQEAVEQALENHSRKNGQLP